jgi:shikimate kinase
MVITFIGLSGCGKSYLSERIAEERGFRHLCCDDMIEQKLSNTLTQGGYSSIEGVAKWMGQPFEQSFASRQQAYLDAEQQVMNEVLDGLGSDGWGLEHDYVVDTTGSVIYMNDELLSGLKERSRIIYLGIPDSELDFMFKQYLAEPKPVVWGDSFNIQSGESNEDVLKRCYPELIQDRTERYYRYADVTLIMDRTNRDKFSTKRILQLAGAR